MSSYRQPRLQTLVLAAGGSRRLGQAKQLLRYRGKTLLYRSITLANKITPGCVTVVLGANHQRLRRMLNHPGCPANSVYNRDWRAGMAGSLLLGLGALPAQTDAALVILCDQPLVTGMDLRRLVKAWRGQPLRPVAAAYAGRLGVPAIIPAKDWPGLAKLDGDRGAGPWLNAQSRRVIPVAMPNAAFDVDTPAELAKLRMPDLSHS